MKNTQKALFDALGTAIGMLVLFWIVELFWNALLPQLFGIAKVTYWPVVVYFAYWLGRKVGGRE